jgi:hypothetical protein
MFVNLYQQLKSHDQKIGQAFLCLLAYTNNWSPMTQKIGHRWDSNPGGAGEVAMPYHYAAAMLVI